MLEIENPRFSSDEYLKVLMAVSWAGPMGEFHIALQSLGTEPEEISKTHEIVQDLWKNDLVAKRYNETEGMDEATAEMKEVYLNGDSWVITLEGARIIGLEGSGYEPDIDESPPREWVGVKARNAVACPKCKAEQGDRCLSQSGDKRDNHPERNEAAETAALLGGK